ncbi:MAG: hypothetical protein ACFFFK_04785, partial [Candidatus Thorarchaeota archaeon]
MTFIHQVFLRRILDSIDPVFTRTFLPWVVKHPRYLSAVFRLGRSYRWAWRPRTVRPSRGPGGGCGS